MELEILFVLLLPISVVIGLFLSVYFFNQIRLQFCPKPNVSQTSAPQPEVVVARRISRRLSRASLPRYSVVAGPPSYEEAVSDTLTEVLIISDRDISCRQEALKRLRKLIRVLRLWPRRKRSSHPHSD